MFTVSIPGSGLVFNNTITSGVTQAFQNCIVAAEQTLAQNWTSSVTVNISFAAANLGNSARLADTIFAVGDFSFAALRSALVAHDQSSVYGQLAAASLPASDPNPAGGADWMLPLAYARMLGLNDSTPTVDDSVTLNTSYNWNYGQDVVNTLIHEISEGAMGRVGGLGDQNSSWGTMDLFRFNASGSHDYSDGRDGDASYFSYNGGQWLSSSAGLSFNNEYAMGRNGPVQTNGGDVADWNQLDVFGTGFPGETNALSQTDLEVMAALGWTSTSSPSVPLSATAGGPNNIAVFNTTVGQALGAVGSPYVGPVPDLDWQYVYPDTNSVNILVSSENWFLVGGPGDDAIQAFGGYNVLDGGTGSNFLVGGSGTDTFFVDDRNPTANIWSTVSNFHGDDDVTLFGLDPSKNIQWVDNQGAPGFSGLTLRATSPNQPTASLTLAGYSTADLSNGRLNVQFGNEQDGTPFMHIIGT